LKAEYMDRLAGAIRLLMFTGAQRNTAACFFDRFRQAVMLAKRVFLAGGNAPQGSV
jgi:hypothetical protein